MGVLRARVVVLALGLALGSTGVAQQFSSNHSSKPMPDGRQWMTHNLSVEVEGSYCYADAPSNCGRYGRLYTWEAARRACRSVGDGWRLPTNDEWQQMAKHYGGVFGDSDDGGKTAYAALVTGGRSGFDVVFGGRRDPNGEYARLDAHGFYWTASATEPGAAWFYNFGGQRFLNRHSDGDQQTALSVRCVNEDGLTKD
jgi:uncharacterized protein (TIGR02145 family)